MIPSVKVFNLDLELIGLVDDYESFYFEEKYSDIGTCTLTLSIYSENYKLLSKNKILYLDRFNCWYIEEISITDDIATITALTLNFILGHRITIPRLGESHLVYKNQMTGDIIKNLISSCLIASPDMNRNIKNLIFETEPQVGHLVNEYKSRYKNLLEEVKALSAYSALGFKIGVDIVNKKFIFSSYLGRDLTNEVIFSEEYDNLSNLVILDSNLSYKNYVYVAGQGEMENRTIISVCENDSISNWFRREEVKDSRDKENVEELYLEGDKILAENCEKTSIEAELLISDDEVKVGDLLLVISKKYNAKFIQRVLQKDTQYTYTNGKSTHIIVGTLKPTLKFDNDTIFE